MRVPCFVMIASLLAGMGMWTQGCAVHYYDPVSGEEHVWGIGHMVMKVAVPQDGHRAIVRGIELVGLSVGIGEGGGQVTAGWERRERIDGFSPDTAIRLEWPDGNLCNVRLGSEWPQAFQESRTEDGGTGCAHATQSP